MRKIYMKLMAMIISILIIAMLVVYANPERFVQIVTGSDYRLVIAAFILSNINVLLRVLKWKILLDNEPFKEVVPVQIIGMTISNFSPGKIAEPIKAVILKLKTGKPVSSSLPSIIWERMLDIFSLILLSMLAILFFASIDKNLLAISIVSMSIFAVAIAVAFLVLYNQGFRRKIFNVLKKIPVTKNISESFIENFGKSKVSNRNIIFSFIVTFSAWLMEGVILSIVFLSIGVSISPLIFASIFALSTIMGIATILPGGLGSTEIIMTIFLGFVGVEPSIAITGVLLYRFISIWYFSFLGGVSLLHMTKKMNISYRSIFM